MGRKSPRRVLATVGLIALAWGTYRAAAGWWYRAELSRASREVTAGRFGLARERLARLARIWPGEAATDYEIGRCEQAVGCPERALATWSRIAPGSPFGAKAARARDELLRKFHDRGRFSALEDVLDAGRGGTGPVSAELGQSLARLWRYEGRFDEVRRLLRVEWSRAADPVLTLRDLWMIDAEPVPVEMVRGVLDQAASLAPDDDRVWLGRANLATWSGRLDEADRWLVACLDRRPRDP